jgi:hypothetical protein
VCQIICSSVHQPNLTFVVWVWYGIISTTLMKDYWITALAYSHSHNSNSYIQWIQVNRFTRKLGQPFIWGKSWRTKTNQEYNQSFPHLFGTPCYLIGPVAATWCTCHYYIISEPLTSQHKCTGSYSCSQPCRDRVCESIVVCAVIRFI